jgi:L-fuculose-phosphate aldolase/L-ribulose-5-phosphate 4-epimerase
MLPFIGDTIRVARFALPGDPEVGNQAVRALEGRKACLLQNHGAVAVGAGLEDALTSAIYMEDAAKIYHMACAVGTPKEIPEEQLRLFRSRMRTKPGS